MLNCLCAAISIMCCIALRKPFKNINIKQTSHDMMYLESINRPAKKICAHQMRLPSYKNFFSKLKYINKKKQQHKKNELHKHTYSGE